MPKPRCPFDGCTRFCQPKKKLSSGKVKYRSTCYYHRPFQIRKREAAVLVKPE